MAIDTTTSVNDLQSQSTPTIDLSNSDVDRSDFLKLLVAQLQHQDPLNPTENQEFVAELATFSSLEQQQNQTALLQKLIDAQASDTNAQALSLIGKDVMAEVEQFRHTKGDLKTFSFVGTSGQAVVKITNAAGRLVHTATVDLDSSGWHEYEFNGVGMDGNLLESGMYNIEITSVTGENGESTSFPAFLRGMVDGVNFADGSPVLQVEGQNFYMSQIFSVMMPQSEDDVAA